VAAFVVRHGLELSTTEASSTGLVACVVRRPPELSLNPPIRGRRGGFRLRSDQRGTLMVQRRRTSPETVRPAEYAEVCEEELDDLERSDGWVSLRPSPAERTQDEVGPPASPR